MAAYNGCICPNRCPVLDQRFEIASTSFWVFAPGCQVIGEDAGGAAKYVILKLDPFIQGYIILELTAIAYYNVIGDVDILA
jgi:hypothetical protein